MDEYCLYQFLSLKATSCESVVTYTKSHLLAIKCPATKGPETKFQDQEWKEIKGPFVSVWLHNVPWGAENILAAPDAKGGAKIISIFDMASASWKSPAEVNILGKRKPEDGLETKPVLKKHKEQDSKSDEATLFSSNVTEETPDFVEDTAIRKKTLFAGYFSCDIRKSDFINLFKDVGEVVRVRFLLTRQRYGKGYRMGYGFVQFASSKQAKKALKKNKCGYLLGSSKISLTKVFDETEKLKKTLFVANLALSAAKSQIINFFKDVGQVVHVRLIVDHFNKLLGYAFVEFASANEAMKVLQTKNGEYFRGSKIFLLVASEGATYRPPKYCMDHRVWHDEDYLEPIELIEDDKTKFYEDVLLVANLSPHTTKIKQIAGFFKDYGKVNVRLIVNQQHKHIGYCFVEFASPYVAKKALEERNGEYLHDHPILLRKGLDVTPDSAETDAVRKKTLAVDNLVPETKISDIIDFFKDVGEVVRVLLVEDRNGKLRGCGFVEFASAEEAKKALEKKNGECLHDCEIRLDAFRKTEFQRRKNYLDYNVCYEEYLGRESPVIEETPEEVEIRKKTLFFATDQLSINIIIDFFRDVGEVVHVRFIVDHWGERMRCGFLEFASAKEANDALEWKNGASIYLTLAETARYSFRHNYDLEERLWHEENRHRESLEFKTELILRRQRRVFCGTKKKLIEEED